MPKSWLNFSLLLLAVSACAQPCRETDFLEQTKTAIRTGDFPLAAKLATQGLDCAEKNHDGPAHSNFLLLKYESLRNQRKFKEAFAAAEAMRLFFKKNAPEKSRLPVSIALAEAYAALRDSLNCLKFLSEARSTAKKFPPDKLTQAWLRYVEGGFSQHFLNNIEDGRAAYQQALQGLAATPDEQIFLQGQALRWLGNTARVQGDFEQSLRHFEQELDLYQKHYPPGQADVAICHYNLGGVLYELLRYRPALDHFLQCFEVWKNTYPPENRYARMLAEAIGDMYWELGDRPKALEFYDRSVVGEPPSRDSSQILNGSADALLQQGKYGAALGFYQQALAFRAENFGRKHPLTAACQNFVGRAYRSAGNTEEALNAYQQSILMVMPGFEDASPYANPAAGATVLSVLPLLEALAGKGELLLQKAETNGSDRDLRAASETLELAVGYLEQFRRSPLSEASKLFWNQRSLPVLENAIRATVLLFRRTGDEKHLETAFALSEKSRAFLLLSALQGEQATQFSGIPAALTDRERQLKNQILDYENKILGEERRCSEAREKQLELWREKLTAVRREYDVLLSRLQKEHPRYFELKYETRAVEIAVLKRALKIHRAALLEFFEGEKQVYVFSLDAARLRVFEVKKDSNYQALTEGFAALLQDKNRFLRDPAQAYRAFTEKAFDLYQRLLAQPLADCPADVQRLLVVPDQRLSAVPFGCLLTEKTNAAERDYRRLPYLLRRFSIFYAPSATVWQQATNQKPPGGNGSFYAGFAPDYAENGHPNLNAPSPLLFSQKEITAAGQIFSGQTFLGKNATERAFRRQSATLLHLAAHALLDDAQPLFSKILLAPADTSEDGLLHAYELYGLRLPAQLAILSACHTAGGHFEQGEGMMSLERGFQYAGCAALLSTFWAADDEASAALTGWFLENIKNGMAKDMALQQAQLRFLEESDPASALPFYWAGWRMAGNVEPLERGAFPWWVWLLGAAGVVVVGIWARGRFF